MKHRKTRPVDQPSNESLRRLYGDRLRNALLSVFIILNLGTVLFMNISPDASEKLGRMIDERLPWNAAYPLHYYGWRIGQYAHLVGLDNRWTMFAHNSRFNWWYVVKAQYADSTVVDLPLFGQGPRTFWQRNLFDFREAKLSLNLYQNILNRKSYSYYLRRQYSTHRDSPITSIIWELHYQDIVNPVESALHGSHLDPTITTRLLNRFDFTPQGDLQ
jgi:hypothetical protein